MSGVLKRPRLATSQKSRAAARQCPRLYINPMIRSGVPKLPLRCNSWMHPVWRAVCQIVCGIGAMRVNSGNGRSTRGDGTSQWPPAPSPNGSVIGISEITVSQVMIHIGGHHGSPVATMRGCLLGHRGRGSVSQGEPKKYNDKSPPLEWGGSQPEGIG